MSSIKDVARLAGVSIATVSRYLNDPESIRGDNRRNVERAIRRADYAPNRLAQNFRRGRTGIIMVVLPSVGDPFFSDVMQGISRVAAERHYSILIRETAMNTLSLDQYSDIVLSKQADGIILLASTCPATPLRPRATDTPPAPIVLGCENLSPELGPVAAVRIDNYAAAIEATRHLLDLGHRRIAFVNGWRGAALTADRERGFRDAMASAGLDVDERRVVEGQLSAAGAMQAAEQLLQDPQPPTAIFCANDEMAIGAMHGIRSHGLSIPGDISVVGFDDVRYAALLNPPLTTVAQPGELIGERAMERILAAIDSKAADPTVEIVPHRLVVRKSTAACEAG